MKTTTKQFEVRNTINNDVQIFNTMDEVNEHIASEIKWFNSPEENENNSGYDSSDFVVNEM